MKPVRTRFALVPEAHLHMATLRMALINCCAAYALNGECILRLEDIYREEYAHTALLQLQQTLRWLGLTWQDGPMGTPVVQSERLEIYREMAQHLIESGQAYRCDCLPQRLRTIFQQSTAGERRVYDNYCRDRHVPEQPGVVVRFRCDDPMGDPVILNADNFPTHHLASIIDDHALDITHVLVERKWSLYQKLHEAIYAAFAWEPPTFIYMPELVNAIGEPISQRSEDLYRVRRLFTQGYLPEAVFNYLALLSWQPQQEEEVLASDELLETFEIERLRDTPTVFEPKRLDWFNQQHLQRKPLEELVDLALPRLLNAYPDQELLRSPDWVTKLIDCVRDSLITLSDLEAQTHFAFFDPDPYSDESWAIFKRPSADHILMWLRDALPPEGDLEIDVVEDLLRDLRKAFKDRPGWGGQHVIAPVMAALTDIPSNFTPESVLALLGPATCRRRIERVLSQLAA